MVLTSSLYQPFSLQVVPDRSEVAVVPAGEVDMSCSGQLVDAVRELRDAGFDRIVVDLRRVDFLDSSALTGLLALRTEALRDGWTLKLVPGPPAAQRIFDVTDTRRLFDWRDY